MAIDPTTSAYTQLGGGIAKNSPRIYEMSVLDVDSAVIEAEGYIDPINQLYNPIEYRPFADGDFIQLKMTATLPPDCLLYQVLYDSASDSYTLVRESMGKVSPPPVESAFTVVYAGYLEWSGGGSTHSFAIPGVLSTDTVIFTPSALPGGYATFKVNMIPGTDAIVAYLSASDPSNLSAFYVVVVRAS